MRLAGQAGFIGSLLVEYLLGLLDLDLGRFVVYEAVRLRRIPKVQFGGRRAIAAEDEAYGK